MSIFLDLVKHYGLHTAYTYASIEQQPLFDVIYDTVQVCQKNWTAFAVPREEEGECLTTRMSFTV
jgi:hypothetical protein